MTEMLYLLPTEEGKIVKKTKYGVYAKFGNTVIFINYSETFTDPGQWEENKQDDRLEVYA